MSFRRLIESSLQILKTVVEKLPEYTNELQEVFRKTDSLKVSVAHSHLHRASALLGSSASFLSVSLPH